MRNASCMHVCLVSHLSSPWTCARVLQQALLRTVLFSVIRDASHCFSLEKNALCMDIGPDPPLFALRHSGRLPTYRLWYHFPSSAKYHLRTSLS
eukprot:1469690-Pleurochrysis_carterae.AAC.1